MSSIPTRFFQSYLVGFLFSIFLVLGGLFFLMVMFLTGSAWSVTMRRVVENMVVTLPFGLILAIPVLLGIRSLYEWAHPNVAHDAVLQAKQSWLNPASFSYRTVFYFLLWGLWTIRIYKHSVRQDKTKSLEQMHTISRWCAPGLLMLILSGTLASFDWSMSLDPHWYSTIFGLVLLRRRSVRVHGPLAPDHGGASGKGRAPQSCSHGALSRSRQMDVRADNLLGLHRVLAIPAHLVREYSGRNGMVSEAL